MNTTLKQSTSHIGISSVWGVLLIGLAVLLPDVTQAEQIISEEGEILPSERRQGDLYEIEANQGDLLVVHLTSHRFDAAISVTCDEAPNQTWINDNYQGQFDHSGLALFAPCAGTYQVQVKQVDSPRGGEYSITVDQYSGAMQAAPLLEITDGALAADDASLPGGELADEYRCAVQPGDLLRFTLSTSTFYPMLVVESVATGDQWEFDLGAASTHDEFLVAVGNTTEVRVWVTAFSDECAGDYHLTVERGTYDDSLGSFLMNTHLECKASEREDCPQFGQPTTEFNEGAIPTVSDLLAQATLSNYECCQGYRPIVIDYNEDGYHDFLTRDYAGLIQRSICHIHHFGNGENRQQFETYPSWATLRDVNGDPIRLGKSRERNNWRQSNPMPFVEGCETMHHDVKISGISLTDFDRDGDLDLLLGSDQGGIYLRRNTGTRKVPVYAAINEILVTETGQPLNTGGKYALIDAGDIDGDGKLDLLGASAEGPIVWFRNIAEDAQGDPLFTSAEVLVQESGKFFPFEAGYSRVELTDHNKDGKLDISVRGWQALEWVCLQE